MFGHLDDSVNEISLQTLEKVTGRSRVKVIKTVPRQYETTNFLHNIISNDSLHHDTDLRSPFWTSFVSLLVFSVYTDQLLRLKSIYTFNFRNRAATGLLKCQMQNAFQQIQFRSWKSWTTRLWNQNEVEWIMIQMWNKINLRRYYIKNIITISIKKQSSSFPLTFCFVECFYQQYLIIEKSLFPESKRYISAHTE